MLHPGEEDVRKEIDTSTIVDVQQMAIAVSETSCYIAQGHPN